MLTLQREAFVAKFFVLWLASPNVNLTDDKDVNDCTETLFVLNVWAMTALN